MQNFLGWMGEHLKNDKQMKGDINFACIEKTL